MGPESDKMGMQLPKALIVRFVTWLVGLHRFHKRAILVTVDLICLTFALWLAMSFRLGEFYVPPDATFALLLGIAPIIGVTTFAWFGLYRLVTRYIGHKGTTAIAVCMGLSVLIWSLAIVMSGVIGVPRSIIVLYAMIGAALVYGTRQIAALLLVGAGHSRACAKARAAGGGHLWSRANRCPIARSVDAHWRSTPCRFSGRHQLALGPVRQRVENISPREARQIDRARARVRSHFGNAGGATS